LPDVKNIAYTMLSKKLIEIIRRYPWLPMLPGKMQFHVHGTSWMYILEYNNPQNRSMNVRKKELLFSGSLDEQHGSEEPDDHGYR